MKRDPDLPEDFFRHGEGIIFYSERGPRYNTTTEEFEAARIEAEKMYGNISASLVGDKIKTLLGKPMSFSDKVNFAAADAIPDNRYYFALLVRHLSWDDLDAKLSEPELKKLRQGLISIGKEGMLDLKILK